MKFLLVFLLIAGTGYGLYTQRQKIQSLEAALADATGKAAALQQKVDAEARQSVPTANALTPPVSGQPAPSFRLPSQMTGSALDEPARGDRKH